MQADKLEYALRTTLATFAASLPPDDFHDIVQFLLSECRSSGLDLDSSLDEDDRTLQVLSSHPLTAVLEDHLVDLLDLPRNDIPLVIDELLDSYAHGPPVPQVDTPADGSERLCELCERPTALTEHHLIPRTEHNLFVKRGIFTIEECRTRIAMCCRPCHSAIHRAKSTRELASEYNTVNKLLELPEVARFAEWNSKRKVLHIVPKGRKQR